MPGGWSCVPGVMLARTPRPAEAGSAWWSVQAHAAGNAGGSGRVAALPRANPSHPHPLHAVTPSFQARRKG